MADRADRSDRPGASGAFTRRPERPVDTPLWRRAANGIGWVVAMAVVVAVVGIVLAWLATIVL